MLDFFLFSVFPYVAVTLALVVGIYRYRVQKFSYSSLSTQFFEKRKLFWGSIPWHYGIIMILLAHLFIIVFTEPWKTLVGKTSRLYTVEIIGLSIAVWALMGLLILIYRRFSDSRLRAVTSPMDIVLLLFLLWQTGSGIYIALFQGWGAQWIAATAVPWIHSLLVLEPKPEYVSTFPWVLKIHMLGGFILLALFPFTRLVHVVSFPLPYLWRRPQVVRWYKKAKRTS